MVVHSMVISSVNVRRVPSNDPEQWPTKPSETMPPTVALDVDCGSVVGGLSYSLQVMIVDEEN